MNIRRPLKVALRICLQTLHVNEHSSTPESGSKNMSLNIACEDSSTPESGSKNMTTNLACEGTFDDHSKRL
jgi:hypothetical protein